MIVNHRLSHGVTNLHYYALERRVSRLTLGANLVEIEPKEANKKYTHD